MKMYSNILYYSPGRFPASLVLNLLSRRDTLVIYEIARAEVEGCHTDRLLHDLRIAGDNPFALAGPGGMIISVTGYEDDPRELLEIPEFIRFARKAEEAAPCWLYFNSEISMALTGSRWPLTVLAACCQVCPPVCPTGEGRVYLLIEQEKCAHFNERQRADYHKLCKIAGVKPRRASRSFEAAVRAMDAAIMPD